MSDPLSLLSKAAIYDHNETTKSEGAFSLPEKGALFKVLYIS